MLQKFLVTLSAVAMVSFGETQAAGAASYGFAPTPAIRGTIASIDGKYNITVRDRRGNLDSVTLHQGTVITPTGLQLEPGYRVAIYGRLDGSTFQADDIVTPYPARPPLAYAAPDYAPFPAFGFYPVGYWAPPIIVRYR